MIGKRIYSGFPSEENVGYARAVVVDDWVFVSGTTGFDARNQGVSARRGQPVRELLSQHRARAEGGRD